MYNITDDDSEEIVNGNANTIDKDLADGCNGKLTDDDLKKVVLARRSFTRSSMRTTAMVEMKRKVQVLRRPQYQRRLHLYGWRKGLAVRTPRV